MRVCAGARGQAVPLVALVIWIVAGAAVVVALVGERAVERARTQAGADAVALAAAAGGDASALAAANSVTVEEITGSAVVDVVVRRGEVGAAARADGGRQGWEGLAPEMRAALARAESVLGTTVPIVSGFRSRADQERLWANRATNPYPVARPGTSRHEQGLAIDVPASFAPLLASVGPSVGLCRPLPVTDPVHFVVC